MEVQYYRYAIGTQCFLQDGGYRFNLGLMLFLWNKQGELTVCNPLGKGEPENLGFCYSLGAAVSNAMRYRKWFMEEVAPQDAT